MFYNDYVKMVQSIIDVNEREDRILNIVKAQQGFKNKSQAVEFVLRVFADTFLEPEVHPEYLEKLQKLEKKGNFIKFNSVKDLRESIENA